MSNFSTINGFSNDDNGSNNNGGNGKMNNGAINLQVLKNLREQNKQIQQQNMVSDATLKEIENMYYEVMNVKDEVRHSVTRIEDVEKNIIKLNDEINNKVFITEAMADKISELIRKKSTFVAKEVYGYNLNFDMLSKAIGKVRPKFWSLLKSHCDNVSKYRHIKYKDYEKAITYVENLSVQDYFDYCGGYSKIPTLN